MLVDSVRPQQKNEYETACRLIQQSLSFMSISKSEYLVVVKKGRYVTTYKLNQI
jgi:hypothetical protein